MLKRADLHALIYLVILLGAPLIGFVGMFSLCILGVTLALIERPAIQLKMIRLIAVPVIIVIIGLLHAQDNQVSNVLRDGFRYISPVVTLVYGYILARYLDINRFLRYLIIAATISSITFLLSVDAAALNGSIQQYKDEVGRATSLTAVGLGLFLVATGFRDKLFDKQMGKVLILINLAAIVLSFSRTFWLILLIIVVIRYKSLPRVGRGMILGLGVSIALTTMTVVLWQADAGEGNRTTFFGKVATSIDEIIPSDYSEKADITSRWRGYEAYRALVAYSDGRIDQYLLGHGIGKTADLGLVMNLGEGEFREIYQFHNGYANLLLKTGIVGILIYLAYFVSMAVRAYRFARKAGITQEQRFAGQMIAALAMVILVTTLSISGWLNKGALMPVILSLGWLHGYLNAEGRRRLTG